MPSPILGVRVTKMRKAPALQLSPPGACRKVEETPNVHRTFQFINRDGEVPRDGYGVENDLHREGEGFKDERRHFTRQIVGGGIPDGARICTKARRQQCGTSRLPTVLLCG